MGRASNRAITRQIPGLSKDSLRRHRLHVREAIREARQTRETLSAEAVLASFEELRARVIGILDQAEARSNFMAAIRAVAEARQLLEAAADLAGLREQPQGPRIIGARFSLYGPPPDGEDDGRSDARQETVDASVG